MKKIFVLLACLQLVISLCFAQGVQPLPKFWDDVQTIKKYDKIYTPSPNPILFIGSSSIRKWTRVNNIYGKYDVINRGIGGARTPDIIFYLNDLVFPYNPRQIVIYVGENDLTTKTITPDTVLNRTIKLIEGIRAGLPNVPIIYISIKSSPSRNQIYDKVTKTNILIKKYLSSTPSNLFLDVESLMKDKDGRVRPELFMKDMVHLNEKGYAIWEKAIEGNLIIKGR